MWMESCLPQSFHIRGSMLEVGSRSFLWGGECLRICEALVSFCLHSEKAPDWCLAYPSLDIFTSPLFVKQYPHCLLPPFYQHWPLMRSRKDNEKGMFQPRENFHLKEHFKFILKLLKHPGLYPLSLAPEDQLQISFQESQQD